MFAILAALHAFVALDGDARPLPVKLPGKDESPIFGGGLPRAGESTPAPRKRFFGLGVVFQSRPIAQGVIIDQVVAGSPADRVGLVAGTVIAEINGESTLGRSGEECTRMVREAGNTLTVKYYDPATLKLRTRTVDKDWFLVPSGTN